MAVINETVHNEETNNPDQLVCLSRQKATGVGGEILLKPSLKCRDNVGPEKLSHECSAYVGGTWIVGAMQI